MAVGYIRHDSAVGGPEGSVGGRRPMRWSGGVMTELTYAGVATPATGHAYSVSDDGTTVVGFADAAPGAGFGRKAFRWTAQTGLVSLLAPAGRSSDRMHGFDVSADGSVIVGDIGFDAMVWDAVNGMRTVEDALVAAGADVTGWNLISASAISGDGLVITGTGTYNGTPQAFVAVIPEPTSLGAVVLSAALIRRRRQIK